MSKFKKYTPSKKQLRRKKLSKQEKEKTFKELDSDLDKKVAESDFNPLL